ncbi:hypothetical protein HRbin16_00859 [bacterium HR16]|nr:hypothetical protein HRbin16_00859 [bacterium HR16]
MTSDTTSSARHFAVIALGLTVIGVVMLVAGRQASGLEILSLSGMFALLVASVVGIIALVIAVVSRVSGATVAMAGAAIVAPVVMLSAVLFPIFRSAHIVAQSRLCMQHLRTLSMAMLLYAEDWDKRYPPSRTWCDSIRPYVRSMDDYRCPAARHLQCGYAMNARLDRFKMEDLAQPEETVMLFDAIGGWNLAGGKELVARRHGDTPNFAFANGRVAYRYRVDSLRWEAR